MKKIRKASLLTALAVATSIPVVAQTMNNFDEQAAKSLHANGSMNVVIIVIAVIISGLLIWLWRIDRKLVKLEHEKKDTKS
ncbi:MAG TPA: hypothetical protein VI731_02430 [Bacteroidia bacterium]|nr:hypothetical protein [Bacteroidia bacterium]